jgi:radical SAM protein with 4Fe4S-binding SPASM domain
MIDHRLTAADQTRLVFTQAVPGLAGILLDRSLITEMADKSVPLGSLFGYKPDAPRKDLIFQPCCLEVPAELRFASGRLVADTDRAMVRIRQLLHDRPESDLISTGQWLMESDERAEPFPREVEIELTTDDPHPDTILRPRGQRVGQRGPLDLECVRKIAVELSSRDDSLVVLGGFGDPLRHPSFEEVVRLLRPGANCRGVYGLAIRSASLDLSESCIDCLIRSGADVLNVLLDAWTPSTYSLVHEAGASQGPGLEAVLGWLQQISDRRRAAGSVVPIVVPEFCKAKENVVEMDVFFDEWTRRLGTVSLVGYSHHAGQLPPRAVADMRPPTRTACRRLRTRCMILADGSVVQCDQDYRGVSPIGRMADQSLEEIWNSAKLRQLRADHQAGDWNANALCDRCEEWHRP